jgi:hypothetical protein
MTDLYLKAATEAAMNAVLIEAGLAYDDNGVLTPASDVSLDVIGSIVKWDYSVKPPVEIVYPEWHVNVRSFDLTEEQIAQLQPVTVTPPQQPFRVWA